VDWRKGTVWVNDESVELEIVSAEDRLAAAMLVDDVVQSIKQHIKENRYTSLWHEDVPVESWLEDLEKAQKRIGVNS